MPNMSKAKYVIVIPDGAADEPFAGLDGRTPLQAARLPAMDRIARDGQVGRSRNVPDRYLPASDVATLSLLGYDPERYYTGRAPLEAAAMGVTLGPCDWAVRCNLMTIRDERLTDFTAGHITSEEGQSLMAAIQAALGTREFEFRPGVSYRNLMIHRGQPNSPLFGDATQTDPPHDHPGEPVAEHLPRGPGSQVLRGAHVRGKSITRSKPRQRGTRPVRQTSCQRDLALGTGQSAKHAAICRPLSENGCHDFGR